MLVYACMFMVHLCVVCVLIHFASCKMFTFFVQQTFHPSVDDNPPETPTGQLSGHQEARTLPIPHAYACVSPSVGTSMST